MARTIQQIQDELITAVQADPTLSGLTSVSSVAIWRLWTRVTAGGLNTFEQLLDAFKEELEQIAREAVPGTADWLQKRVLEFQYDGGNPQVVQVIDGKATYPVVDESLRIVARAAVKDQSNGRVLVKVAKDDGGGGLEPLTPVELSALVGYLIKIGFVGIPIDVVSQFPDRLRLEAEVFYLGEYVETVVKANVIDAINAYLESISIDEFNGIIVREKIIDAIQAVDGVSGVDTLNVDLIARPSSVPLGGNTISVVREYETSAGYIIEEDTALNTFEDTITMTLDA